MKKWFMLPVLILMLFLTSCGNGDDLSAEEAADLFINRLIYEKSNGEFTSQFVNGKDLANNFNKNAQNFCGNFTSSLEAISNNDFTDEDALELTRELIKEMDGKTTYTIKNQSTNGDYTSVTFEIHGLDFTGIIRGTVNNLVKDYRLSPEIMEDKNIAGKRAISILKDEIKDVEIKEKPIEISLVLKKSGHRWQIADNQNKRITSIFLAFISGEESQDDLTLEINNEVAEVVQELLNEVDAQKETSDTKESESSSSSTAAEEIDSSTSESSQEESSTEN